MTKRLAITPPEKIRVREFSNGYLKTMLYISALWVLLFSGIVLAQSDDGDDTANLDTFTVTADGCESGTDGGRTGGSCSSGSGSTNNNTTYESNDPGAGSSTEDYFPPECNTGDEAIDSSDEDYDELWADSNPDAENLSDREEQGVIRVPDGSGGYDSYRLGTDIPATLSACNVAIDSLAPLGDLSTLPAGIVLVHTHPLDPGASLDEACPGSAIGMVAQNGPSNDDLSTLRYLERQGAKDIKGVKIDRDETHSYDPELGSEVSSHGRCGY